MLHTMSTTNFFICSFIQKKLLEKRAEEKTMLRDPVHREALEKADAATAKR